MTLTASDRLRVASALDAMPELDDALDGGELPYSAVREIARVATSRTAGAWVDACRGKCLRDVEDLVAQHAEGDLPDAPPRERARPQILRLELEGSDHALWRQARQVLEGERDEAVADRELLAAACTALIERALTVARDAQHSADPAQVGEPADIDSVDGSAHVGEPADIDSLDGSAHVGELAADIASITGCADGGADPATVRGETDGAARGARPRSGTQRLGSEAQRGRAKYQIAVVVCEVCKRGWQEGGGKRIPISEVAVARAECDAQRVGSLEDGPQGAEQDVPPKTRRFVFRRDGDRCTVPGCRASSFIEVHHIVHREHGGGSEPENLTLLCGGHHDAHHAGRLVIRGRAPDLTFELAGERLAPAVPRAHVGTPTVVASSGDEDVRQMRADAVLALHTLGFKKPEAIAAVDAALATTRPPVDLETLLRLALPRCPR